MIGRSHFPGYAFRNDAYVTRGAWHISPRAAAVAKTIGWLWPGGVLLGLINLRRSRLNKAITRRV